MGNQIAIGGFIFCGDIVIAEENMDSADRWAHYYAFICSFHRLKKSCFSPTGYIFYIHKHTKYNLPDVSLTDRRHDWLVNKSFL